MSYRQSPLGVRGHRSRRPHPGLVIGLALVLVIAGVLGVYLWQGRSHNAHSSAGPSASSTPASRANELAGALAAAWTKGDFSAMSFGAGLTGADVQREYAAITKGLQARSVQVTAHPAQPVPGNDNAEHAVLSVTWRLAGDQEWSYDSGVEIDAIDGQSALMWSPAVVQPTLQAGDTLKYVRVAAKRSTILDGAGAPIITDRAVVDIGLEAGKVSDPAATASQMAGILGINGPSLAARLKGAPANQFVDVITLRQADFDNVAAKVNAVQGVILRKLTLQLSPSHDFARSLLGTVGPVTKEIVDASKGRYVAGDVGGLGGLEKEFDTTIGGTPGLEIDVLHAAGASATATPTVLERREPVDGVPLRTTLDQKVQAAADAAVATITNQPSALVAVRVSTGQVVAVANGPSGSGFDTGLLGQVPPGSAFKVVTTTALLEHGQDVNAPVTCSPQILVQGKTFHNYEGEQLGSVPFHTDFAKSCNTAFISLSSKVGGPTLTDTAARLGIGACWSLGTQAFHGRVSKPKDLVDLAATSFGQGSTLVSPVSLAVAVGTIARGHYVAPQLVLNGRSATGCTSSGSPAATAAASASPANSAGPASSPASASGTPAAGPAAAEPPGPPLSPSVVTRMHALMREVVTAGTAAVLAKAPGGPVMAKTGTAEYGPGSSPKTHAWLIGYQGDIAFAVYVQDGRSGGTVAAPVALAFLQNLARH